MFNCAFDAFVIHTKKKKKNDIFANSKIISFRYNIFFFFGIIILKKIYV